MVEMCVSHVYQNVPANQLCPWRRAMAQDLGHSWHHILLDWSYKCWNRLHELVHTNLKAQSLSWIVTPPVIWRPDVSESQNVHHCFQYTTMFWIAFPSILSKDILMVIHSTTMFAMAIHGEKSHKIPPWLAHLCPSRRRISSGFRSLEFRMGKHGRLLTIILWYH